MVIFATIIMFLRFHWCSLSMALFIMIKVITVIFILLIDDVNIIFLNSLSVSLKIKQHSYLYNRKKHWERCRLDNNKREKEIHKLIKKGSAFPARHNPRWWKEMVIFECVSDGMIKKWKYSYYFHFNTLDVFFCSMYDPLIHVITLKNPLI